MDVLMTLVYLLFSICVVYPPTEFVTAGFTIAQLYQSYLGSENVNFVGYHMKRITITALIHSALPMGYILCLYFGGERSAWLLAGFASTAILPLLMVYKIVCWWECKTKHPAVAPLLPYVVEGSDWRVVAAQVNTEFRGVDKVSLPLTATSKLVATETWLIKVTSYNLFIIKQSDCGLVATDTDIPDLTASIEEETQYVNIQVVPSRDDVAAFKFRITTQALRDLQPRLSQTVRVPSHISLLPSLVERFVAVFNQHVDQNPVYYVDEELEVCIGCMQAPADVKLRRRCRSPPAHLAGGPPECQQCNCRVLWCSSCMARWWAARASAAGAPPDTWLSSRGSCPVCRSTCCLLDVCPARSRAES